MLYHDIEKYFFCILATVHPNYYKQLVRTALDARFAINTEEKLEEAVELSERWANDMDAYPRFAKKKGRFMSHMKANCKVGIATKPRKKHKAFMPNPN